MALKMYLPVMCGALALGLNGFGLSAQAAKQQCASEECACEQALEQNTVEALEDFLRKYPQSVNNQDSACGALAVPPDDGFSEPEGQSHDDHGIPDEPVLTPAES